ncbi:MAG: RagB/SusD family nutrient uptake outer membrane protein [Bacteroidaceae bacterium]|nr:RagB/SusD family nutrient uptake outer membrane protein [Bacteroidaceae bacterium]
MKNSFKILSIATVATLALFMSGCQDFLTIYPTDKVVLENYWKNKEDVQNMVANSYRKMTEKSFLDRLIVWGELRSDDVCEGTNTSTELKYINDANLLPSNSFCSWSDFYSIINNCNIVMKFAPTVLEEDPDFTQGDMDVIRGEMLAIRALCHFYLVRTFRDIPLLKEAMVDDSQELYQDQVTPLEALDFILEDLYEAEGLVMESGSYSDLEYNKGRITADAVRAMIADVMLWKAAFTQFKNKSDGSECYEYYTTCIDYCERIIKDRNEYLIEYEKKNNYGRVSNEGPSNPLLIGYPLNTYPTVMGMSSSKDPYSTIFGQEQNDLKESIFEIQGNENNNPHYSTNEFYGCQGHTAPFNATSLLGGSGTDVNLYKDTDLRRYSFTMGKEGEEDVYDIAKYTQIDVNYTTTSNPPYKTQHNPRQTSSGGSGYYSSTNWIVYRITDVMLMEAEALALRNDSTLGDEAKAFKIVKATYYRSNPYKVSRSDSITLNNGIIPLVRDERQRELCFEGKRWYDLVRWALREGTTAPMLSELVGHKYETNQNAVKSKMANIDKLFFPISENEIKTSNGHLKQNPSYDIEDVYQKY